ncbi:MAG: B12-binding domain-containing radical SAM protein [Nanoarchaeota archaeon]|nr:B12-binding domain-containing radical SAM protein [Nanoarchaeota archaeon]
MIKQNILLLHPPFKELKFGKAWEGIDSIAPPLGLMYLATPLIKKGHKVNYIDLNVDQLTKKQFESIIKKNDIICISCYTDALDNVKKIIKLIRGIDKNKIIICGGPYCSLSRNYIPGSDLVAVGEAEVCIDKIVERLVNKKPLDDIQGLVYKHKGKIIDTKGMLKAEDLNKNPHSAFSLATDKNYGVFFGFKVKGVTGIMSSRGCPFHCDYCTHKGLFKYRERSVDNVISELKQIQSNGYKYVAFYDDNFLANKKRVTQIMDRMIKEKIKLKMLVQGRVESADYSFFKKLRKAGVFMIMFGIENANQDVLDFYNKGTNIKKIKRAIELCNKAGIITFGYMMLGAPQEDEKYFEVNKQFVNSVPLDYMNINILGYYQGSKLWDDAVKAGKIKPNETIMFANERVSQYTYDEWLEIKEELLRSFYKDKKRLIRFPYKLIRLGMFPLLLNILWSAKGDFIERVKNPFANPKRANVVRA